MLLAVIAVVAIGAALWTAEPSWLVGAVELSVSAWLLASVVTLIAHSRGKAKVFWLGVAVECATPMGIHAALAYVATLERRAWYFDAFLINLSIGFRTVLLLWAFAPLVGLLCVLTHRLFIRSPEPKD